MCVCPERYVSNTYSSRPRPLFLIFFGCLFSTPRPHHSTLKNVPISICLSPILKPKTRSLLLHPPLSPCRLCPTVLISPPVSSSLPHFPRFPLSLPFPHLTPSVYHPSPIPSFAPCCIHIPSFRQFLQYRRLTRTTNFTFPSPTPLLLPHSRTFHLTYFTQISRSSVASAFSVKYRRSPLSAPITVRPSVRSSVDDVFYPLAKTPLFLSLQRPPLSPLAFSRTHCPRSLTAIMPPPDDDIFNRMFASFVARKTRPHRTYYPPPPPQPDTLRHVANDLTGRRQSSHHASSSDPRHHMPTPAGKHPRSSSRTLGALVRGRSKSSKSIRPPGSKSSKGSKGSESKAVSASTEDAPPKKRARAQVPTASKLSSGALMRTQSAHAGSLNRAPVLTGMNNDGKLERSKTMAKLGSSSGAASKPPKASKPKDNKKFPCDKCPSTFAQKGQLSRHVRRVHEKLRPYGCEYCGRLFGARSDRTRHIMVSNLFHLVGG